MAIIQANFMSQSLMRTVPIQVILPVDKFTRPGEPAREDKPFKTLYLLHGIFGNCTDWLSGTRVQRWAEEKNLAVVMPSGENGFYIDQEHAGNFYGEYIGKELIEMTRKMFPLSDKREDTFIAGLSMGGYGAIRNGLKYNETFGAIAGLSGALILDAMQKDDFQGIGHEEHYFGNLKEAYRSDKNPKVIIDELMRKKSVDGSIPIPDIYIACGTEDFLIEANRDLKAYLEDKGIKYTYEEGPGSHSWDFWDTYIKRVIDWLPLEDTTAGINSGNVN